MPLNLPETDGINQKISLVYVKGSLWNTVRSITLEHIHFGIALEHKMLHHIRPQPKKTNIRFIDKRSTLEGPRVPKRCLYKKKDANERFSPYIITSTVMALTTLWPWNSLCSTN